MDNLALIGENPQRDAIFLVCQSNIMASSLLLQEQQERNELMLLIQQDEQALLDRRRHNIELLEQISLDALAKVVAESVIRQRLVCHDIFYEIFHACPIFMTTEPVRRRHPEQYRSSHWWSITHPDLSDFAEGRHQFKAHYRITKKAFEVLVNELIDDEEYIASQARGDIPVEIQVAVVLWRFANSHFGVRLICTLLNIHEISLNKFSDRFVKAMLRVGEKEITWPKDDLQTARHIAHQFKNKNGCNNLRLDKIIGAMDGKSIVL